MRHIDPGDHDYWGQVLQPGPTSCTDYSSEQSKRTPVWYSFTLTGIKLFRS